jgi:OOP family OmpA-OmpF porin
MMRTRLRKAILLLSLIIVSTAFAQTKGEWIRYANEAFAKRDYPTAINFYNHVLSDTAEAKHLTKPYEVTLFNAPLQGKNKSKVDTTQKAKPSTYDFLMHQLAASYRLNADYHSALKYYEISAKRPDLYPEDVYWYGNVLMNLKKYNEAMDQFEVVVALKNGSDSLKKQGNHGMNSCYYALDSTHVHKLIKVSMLDTNINKGTANFAPMYHGGPHNLIFTSARKGNIVSGFNTADAEYLCDLYFIERKDDKWQDAVHYSKPVNSGIHEGAGQITIDDNFFFTRWTDANRKESAIYMARYINNHFMEPLKLGLNVNVPGYKSAHPYVTMDGSRLFFSSDRPGGHGGMDIWFCYIDENGTTSTPKCLGDVINTAADEVTPFYHGPSSTLFFSSNGHTGLGGLDIFKSAYSEDDSTYSPPKNMGPPVNSSKDDAYLIIDRLQQHGYFASDREDCPSGHCYDLYEFENEPISFDLSGYVYDFETGEPIPSALVTIKDVHGEMEPMLLITDDKGFYSTPLKEGMEYFLKAQKSKYFADMANLATKGLTETKHFDQDFNLNKIPEGDIVIEGIEYDLNKTTLRPESKKILDKIYDLIHANDNLSIEVNAHTDTRGSDTYNMKLSAGRAQSCVDYLISKGIQAERIVAKGYGETKPLISDEEIAKLGNNDEKEAAHQKNRRTAFKVIGETKLHIINKAEQK